MTARDETEPFAWLRNRLRQGAQRVREAAPGSSSSIFERERDGVTHLCLSSLATPTADTVDLCLEIRAADGMLIVTGDLVVGGSGEVLAALEPAVTFSEGDTPSELVEFIDEQVERIVGLLRQP